MEFKASYGKTVKIVTILVTAFFAWLIFYAIENLLETGMNATVYVPVVLIVVYAAAFLYSPLKYSVTKTDLIIHRPIGNAVYKKQDITSVGVLESGLPGAVRTFGVGGLFGYFGTFYNFDVGNMRWYATRRDKCVLIKTSGKKNVVVTPDDAEGFAAALST